MIRMHSLLLILLILIPQIIAKEKPAPLQLEETPKILIPLKPLTEKDQDRLHARAMFATGRLMENNRKYSQALRHYQRAVRYDPSADKIRNDIVILAIGLGRIDESARYAVGFQSSRATVPRLLRQLAVEQVKKDRFSAAVKLTQLAFAGYQSRGKKKKVIEIQMDLGRLYFIENEYKNAAKTFTIILKAIQQPKKYGLSKLDAQKLLEPAYRTYGLMGESFLQAGMINEAETAFKKANQAKKESAIFAFNMARIQFNRKKFDAALKELQAYLNSKKRNEGVEPYQLLRDIYTATGKSAQLIQHLEKIYKNDAKDNTLGYFLAQQYQLANKKTQAVKLYEDLNKKRPMLPGYRALLGYYHQSKQVDKTLAILSDYLLHSRASDLKLLKKPGEDLLADQPFCKQIIQNTLDRLKRNDKELKVTDLTAAAMISAKIKMIGAMNQFYESALKIEKKDRNFLWQDWIIELIFAEKNRLAIDVLNRATKDESLGDAKAFFYYLLAGVLADEKDFEKAKIAAKQAAKLRSNSVRYVSREAWVLWRAKQNDQALKKYRAILKKYDSSTQLPNNRDALKQVRFVMSSIYVDKKNIPQAQQLLEEVLDEFPEDIGAANDLGYLWADQNKHLQRAHRMITRAVDAEPENKAYRDSLGWILYRRGKYKDAAKQLKLAIDKKNPDGVIYDHLANVMIKLGKKQTAVTHWQQALKLFKESKEIEKVKKIEGKLRALNQKK